MRDREIINAAVHEAIRILSEHIVPGRVQNNREAINRLLAVLDNEKLAGALDRVSKEYGLKIAK